MYSLKSSTHNVKDSAARQFPHAACVGQHPRGRFADRTLSLGSGHHLPTGKPMVSGYATALSIPNRPLPTQYRLTASTFAIQDADGIPSGAGAFSFRWQVRSGAVWRGIHGATASALASPVGTGKVRRQGD
ncbi:hypothetical protein [Pseudomonas sp. LFM046]|uniref:hypothetical protein n=1 Tax=Pseudomonas sp. LFM046 TaxID=1608357 RepID=UPI0005CFC39F|nr:hypothetical protein [Pseudomonas sp. LFM046]